MGMVVIQPCILVSKPRQGLYVILRFTGYIISIQKPTKQDLLLILVPVLQQNFLNC